MLASQELSCPEDESCVNVDSLGMCGFTRRGRIRNDDI